MLETNMKWILLFVIISFQSINCDRFQNDHGNNVLAANGHRNARTVDLESTEDESGIHLHFWNDMDNNNNFYPNLMKHIMAESMGQKQPTQTTTPKTENSDSIHINLNELLPQPQPQVSPKNLLKNALLKTLTFDEFRKSDQNLYGSNYKLNADRFKQSPFNWNYHPSAINYIPKAYDTNINNAAAAPTQLPIQPLPMGMIQQRPSLHNQIHTTKHFIQDYYTNLHKAKPKSVIDAVGYEIGGLPKYSGRLLANEPMPQQYRTFKMFEPVPRQIMLPPPTARIPEFKPVPPRLKIIPVIDEYLETRPNPMPTPNTVPWNVIKPEEKPKPLNYLYPVPTKQVQIIPFTVSEAVTKPPLRTYIPKTEPFNFIEPSTESYYMPRFKSPKILATELITPEIATKTPKLNVYLPIQRDHIINTIQSQHAYEPMNEPILNNENEQPQNTTKLQMFTNEDHPVDYDHTKKLNHKYNINDEAVKLVSIEDSRSTLNTKTSAHRVNNDIVEPTRKKNAHKKSKAARKSQRQHENLTNDVIKLNVTGFRNVTEDGNQIGNDSDSSVGSHNNTPKKESNVKNNDKLRLHASHEYSIDSVAADTIQLSQAYSRQITNVPLANPTPPVSKREQDDSLLLQLANDVKKTLLTSLGSDTNSSDFGGIDSIREIQPDDPFLIAVFDEHDRKYDPKNLLGNDLQLAETDRSDAFIGTNSSNNSIQRIDHDWATDPNEDIKPNVDKRDGHQYTNHRMESNAEIYNATNDMHIENPSTETTNHVNSTFIDDKYSKYYKWYNNYAEENKKLGRTIISEHFKKVQIEPNISWVVLPR